MSRAALLRAVENRIGRRRLVWFGTRGDDVESAAQIDQLSTVISLINTYRRRASVESVSLEDISKRRPDLDTWDLDAHPRDQDVRQLREALLRAVARPSVLFTYRPSAFLSAIAFARADSCDYVGMFSGHQVAFEHKPWVESSLAGLGIPHVPWRYVADSDLAETRPLLDEGPIVLRRSRTTGGVGLVRLSDPADLEALWPDEDEAFVSVAPFLDETVPVNVAGVVWHDGVTVHPASVQLIGLPECTTRPFGYCGNDFVALKDLGREVIDSIETSTRRVGEWLGRRGYIGTYGVDFMVKDGVALFTEVNPRFQGSSHLSAEISVELDLGCVFVDHLAACLGLDSPRTPPLWELTAAAPPRAHVVTHSLSSADEAVDPDGLVDRARDTDRLVRADALTHAGLVTAPSATTARLTFGDRVTTNGFDLLEPFASALCPR